jgi:hypothetical protein
MKVNMEHPVIKKQKRIEKMEDALKMIAAYPLLEDDGLIAIHFQHIAEHALKQ